MTSLKVTEFFVLSALSTVFFATLTTSVYLNEHGKITVNHIKNLGYPVEAYNVVSEDGYFLTTVRIPGGRFQRVNSIQNATQKPTVLLMHGLGASSFHYVATGPTHSVALILADSGYDVWMPNTRGTTLSRKHVHLNPDRDAKYWDFSFHEIGYYDLPANIDLIRNVTGKNEMTYVGFLQGTTVFFVMGADRPEYNKYFKVSIMLGPSVYVGHTTSFLINLLRFNGLVEPLKEIVKVLRIHELLPSKFYPVISTALSTFCAEGNPLQPICMRVLTLPFDANYDISTINSTILPMFLRYGGTGMAVRQAFHYFQLATTGEFEQYDFGIKQNMLRYNAVKPPPYNLRNIQVPIILIIGELDLFGIKVDIDRLTSELPNSTVINVGDNYTHVDYLLRENAPELVHKPVAKLIAQYLGT